MIFDESKLCCGHEVGFGQVVNYMMHCSNGGGNLALSHCGGIEKEREVPNLHGFSKLNATMKKDSYPLLFTEEVLDMVVGHEVYLFLDGFLGYHQITIAP
jgi:hypothetical protein